MSKLGLVLAGGGGKGAYQIGVWKALKEFGVDCNVGAISGTSVGALNAIAFLQGDYDSAEKIWLNISHDQILKFNKFKLLNSVARLIGPHLSNSIIDAFLRSKASNGIFSREGLLHIIDKYIDLRIVSSSNINCYITCCHIPSFQPKYFKLSGASNNRIKSILLASSALPIIYDAETIDSEGYIDGGVVDNVPLTPLYNDGYRNFLVVHLSRDSLIQAEKFPNARIIQLVPKSHQGDLIDGTLDFNSLNARDRIQQGYDDTKQVLQPLYEMGMVQEKVLQSIQKIKEDNVLFSHKREKILKRRKELEKELEELLYDGGNDTNGTSITNKWSK